MKHRTRVSRLFLCLSLFASGAAGFADEVLTPQVDQEARDFKIFTDRVQQYIKIQKELKASLPALKPTEDVAQIVGHQQALASKIADARRAARQGDIFTPEVAERFRTIIRRSFQGPEGGLARETILPDSPVKVVVLHVNDVCPDGIPLTTTPPTLLLKLPKLPQELVYRIVGYDLTLQDTEARLIVDIIPNVIR